MKTHQADHPARTAARAPAALAGAHVLAQRQAAPRAQAPQAFPMSPSPAQQQGAALQALVNQSPVVQRAAQQQAQVDAGVGGKGVVQRVIWADRKLFPPTYLQVDKPRKKKGEVAKDPDDRMIDLRDQAMDAVCRKLKLQQPNASLKTIWGKIAKEKKVSFDLETTLGMKGMVNELIKRYIRSQKSKKAYQHRSGQAGTLGRRLTALNTRLKFTKSARNPMVEHRHPKVVTFNDQKVTKQERFATHVSTMGMHLHPEGQEFQASTSKNGNKIHVSSNLNGVNEQLALQKWQMARHLKESAKELLEQLGVAKMTKKKAMNNRLIRHLAKLFWRIEDYLKQDAPVSFPAKIANKLDGMHAEIRITRQASWNKNDFYAPQGTKYPCLGCFIYMNGKAIEVGHFHGPLWVTNSAMTTQMQSALLQGHTVGHLSDPELTTVGDHLKEGYQNRPPGSEFVKGKKRDGTSGYDVNADSDSELEDEEFNTLKSQLGKRFKWQREEEDDSDEDL